MSGPRIGLVGARRVRQGLGPFVARDLAALGADVTCVLGTSADTAEQARAELRDQGIDVRAYADPDALFAAESLDALAILSPVETHEAHLRRALDCGLHVLCEKPLIWSGVGSAERAADLVRSFADRGRVLVENCQWPCTLAAFESLHPGTVSAPLERFEMRLSPESHGEQMLVDSLSHPLSLLQALAPDRDARLEDPGFATGTEPEAVVVRFVYRAGSVAAPVSVRLERGESVPRRASLSINGKSAERLVRKSDYSMLFAAEDRSVALSDPLRTLLERFVRALEAAVPDPESWQIAQRMQMLESLVAAYRGEAV
ncbi:MAG: Gfo/Idh/MocA family oxidoreductase [Deltaproteobacteria bacterium]|nr:Gfo/Idh/MocA family oxidoreductase [Deltaproteobacteria bacterium]